MPSPERGFFVPHCFLFSQVGAFILSVSYALSRTDLEWIAKNRFAQSLLKLRSCPQPFYNRGKSLPAVSPSHYPMPRCTALYPGIFPRSGWQALAFFLKIISGEDLHFFKRRKKRQPSCAFNAAIAIKTAKSFRHNDAGVCFFVRHPAGLIPFPFCQCQAPCIAFFFSFFF